MTQDEIIRMARELATRHGIRMCDEDGETHGEELYCVGVEDIAEIIKQVAAHEREKEIKRVAEGHGWTQAHWTTYEESIAAAEREACAVLCEDTGMNGAWNGEECAAAIRARGEK